MDSKKLLLIALAIVPSFSVADEAKLLNQKDVCMLSYERSSVVSVLPLCFNIETGAKNANILFIEAFRSLRSNSDSTNQRMKELLEVLKPKLKDCDYFYFLGLIESRSNAVVAKKYMEKSSALGSKEASEYMYTFEGGGFEYILRAYQQGSSQAKFLYALDLKSGAHGLVIDQKRAASLVFEAALEGESAATVSVMEYKALLSKDQVDFWASRNYLFNETDAAGKVKSPKISNWPGYCSIFYRAAGAFALLPQYASFNDKQKIHLLDIIQNCSIPNVKK